MGQLFTMINSSDRRVSQAIFLWKWANVTGKNTTWENNMHQWKNKSQLQGFFTSNWVLPWSTILYLDLSTRMVTNHDKFYSKAAHFQWETGKTFKFAVSTDKIRTPTALCLVLASAVASSPVGSAETYHKHHSIQCKTDHFLLNCDKKHILPSITLLPWQLTKLNTLQILCN